MELSKKTKEKVEAFKKIPKQDKYEIVLEFLEVIKDKDELAGKIYNLLIELGVDKTEEEILDDIYLVLQYTLEEIEQEEMGEYFSRMEALRQKLEYIKEQEQKARKEEEKYLKKLLLKLKQIPDAY